MPTTRTKFAFSKFLSDGLFNFFQSRASACLKSEQWTFKLLILKKEHLDLLSRFPKKNYINIINKYSKRNRLQRLFMFKPDNWIF